MKKIFIAILIIINILTIYFWVFPHQTKDSLVTNELANHVLQRQYEIIGTVIYNNTKEIKKKVEAYPEYQPFEIKSDKINAYRSKISTRLEEVIKKLKHDFQKKIPIQESFGEDINKYKFWSRVHPANYQIPKKILFNNNELSMTFDIINQYQDSLLSTVTSDSLRQVLKDKHFIDTEEMIVKFKNIPFSKALVLLQSMKNKTATTAQFIIAHQLKNIEEQINAGLLKSNDFAIMTFMKKAVYEVGETVECDIFTTVYYDSDELLVEINGVEKTMKNGIADFTFTPTSPGTKKMNVTITVKNPLTKRSENYRKEFEYFVIE